MAGRSADGSSTSPRRLSRHSRRSGPASSTSASPGSSGLGRASLRALAARHRIRPSKALGQHFLVDPNLAIAIAADAGAAPGTRVVEVGAGLGSLTVALARAGAHVLAVELDAALAPALREAVAGFPGVRVQILDALRADWAELLGSGRWTMASNLPYNVAVLLLLRMLREAPQVRSYVVMVQREVGERLAARPGQDAYGAVSVKTAALANVRVLRRVPRDVFWPRPNVESLVVRLTPEQRVAPPDLPSVFAVVDASFSERRKTMTNAMRRLGVSRVVAAEVLSRAGVPAAARPEELSLEDFVALAAILRAAGVVEASA